MKRLFCSCVVLKTIIFGDFNTENVEDMSWMFAGGRALTDLDVSFFHTAKVTNMYEMFSSCSRLEHLDLSGFDLSNLENMACMFALSKKLKTIKFGNSGTPRLKDMHMAFWDCNKLEELDLSLIDTGNVVSNAGYAKEFMKNCYPRWIITPNKIGDTCMEGLDATYYDIQGVPYTEISADTPVSTRLYLDGEECEYGGANILYELNGGENALGNPAKYFPDITYTFKDAKRKGYKFTGWYTDASCTKQITELMIAAPEEGTYNEDITLYAGWEKSEEVVSEGIYTDVTCTSLVTGDEAELYVNGTKVKDSVINQIINYRAATYYTSITAPTYTVIKNGKTSVKTGKVIVGLNSGPELPVIKNNKIVSNKEIKNIASISYKKKNHSIIVTAKKVPGTVYAWVVSLSEKDVVENMAYVKVQILPAPNKLEIFDKVSTDQSAVIYKKDSISIGEKVSLYLNPTIAVNGVKQAVTEGDYILYPAKGMEEYVEVSSMSGVINGYSVKAKGLKNNRKTTVKLTAQCVQSGKKATFSLMILNDTKGVEVVKGDFVIGLSLKEDVQNSRIEGSYHSYGIVIQTPGEKTATQATVNVTPRLASSDFAMTDKPKVYLMSNETAFTINQKGAVKITEKPSGINAKIKAGMKNNVVTIKAPKKLSSSASTCLLVVYNTNSTNGYFVMPVSLG